MTKKELTEQIASQTGARKSAVAEVLEVLGATIKDAVARNEEVYLPVIGRMTSKIRAAHTARNLRTGEEIRIAEHRVPVFKPTSEFKNALL